MKNNAVFLAIILFSLSLSVSGQNAKQNLKAGDEFLKNNKFEDAIDQYSKALQIEPDNSKAYTQRAWGYSKLSKYKEAAEDYDRASVFLPKDEVVFYDAAKMYFAINDYQTSLERLKKSLEIKNNYVEAIQLKVSVLLNLKKYDEALADARTALRYKETASNLFYFALANEKLKNYDEAEKSYIKALALKGDYLEAAINLANLLRIEKKYELATSTINRAIKQDMKSIEAYLVRSEIYAELLQFQSSINDISTIISLKPDDPDM